MSLNTILATAPLTTTNYILKATGTTIGNSLIWDNGTNVGIGNTNTSYTLDVSGTGRFTGALTADRVLTAINTTNSTLVFGSVEMQSYALNNAWFGDNIYFNGTAFKARATGYTSQIYFDSGAIAFYTNSTTTTAGATATLNERMRILSGGNVLIGTTAAETASLTALAPNTGTAAIQGRNPNNTTAPIFQASSITTGSTSWYAYVAQSGNGSSITTNTMFVYGNGNIVNVNNSYGVLSDIKLKENIVDATPKLDDILKLKVRNYNLKADENKTKQIGFIAQEMEKIFPALIEETPDKDLDNNDLGTVTKTIKTSVLVPMLVKAIQEQQALITSLQSQINELKNK